MHASFRITDRLTASGLIPVTIETARLGVGQFIELLLLYPAFMRPVLGRVFLEDFFQGFHSPPLGQPALPVRLQVPFVVAYDLLLCAYSSIQALQEILVVLPVRRTQR